MKKITFKVLGVVLLLMLVFASCTNEGSVQNVSRDFSLIGVWESEEITFSHNGVSYDGTISFSVSQNDIVIKTPYGVSKMHYYESKGNGLYIAEDPHSNSGYSDEIILRVSSKDNNALETLSLANFSFIKDLQYDATMWGVSFNRTSSYPDSWIPGITNPTPWIVTDTPDTPDNPDTPVNPDDPDDPSTTPDDPYDITPSSGELIEDEMQAGYIQGDLSLAISQITQQVFTLGQSYQGVTKEGDQMDGTLTFEGAEVDLNDMHIVLYGIYKQQMDLSTYSMSSQAWLKEGTMIDSQGYTAKWESAGTSGATNIVVYKVN